METERKYLVTEVPKDLDAWPRKSNSDRLLRASLSIGLHGLAGRSPTTGNTRTSISPCTGSRIDTPRLPPLACQLLGQARRFAAPQRRPLGSSPASSLGRRCDDRRGLHLHERAGFSRH